MANVKDLQTQYKALAKRADQRLVRLEKLSQTNVDYKAIVTFAYAKAQEDISSLTGKQGERLRFNTKAPDNATELQQRINAIERFLNAPTSSKQRVDRATKSTNKTAGLSGSDKLTWLEVANFWENESSGKFDYTANTFKASIEIKKKSITKEDAKKYLQKDAHVSDDEVVDTIAKRMLKSGLDVDTLFK